SLRVEVSGVVRDPAAVIGAGNVAAIAGDTEFAHPVGALTAAVINRGFTWKVNTGGHPGTLSGPISGSGTVEVHAGPEAPVVIDGKGANTMTGTWAVKAGRVVLAKEPGVDAMAGTIVVGGAGDPAALAWNNSDQLADAADVQ